MMLNSLTSEFNLNHPPQTKLRSKVSPLVDRKFGMVVEAPNVLCN